MKKILIFSFAALLALTSCSDWVKPENLEYPDTPKKDLAAIRAYKASEHFPMFVTLEGTDRLLYSHQHPMNLPDSVDVIVFKNVGNLHSAIADEIKEVYRRKGTESYLMVDFAPIDNEWKGMETEKADAGMPAGTAEEAVALTKERTLAQLALFDKCEYRGIVISFEGNTSGVRGNMQEEYLKHVLDWLASHSKVKYIVRGTIRNIDYEKAEYKAFLDGAEYFTVVTTEGSTSAVEINKQVGRILTYLPVEKRNVIFECNVPDGEKKQFGATLAVGVEWLLKEQNSRDFKPCGVAVANIQDDYYNGSDNVFKLTRAAISLMNPAPAVEE